MIWASQKHSPAHAIIEASKCHHIIPFLNPFIGLKLIKDDATKFHLTYKIHSTNKPSYNHSLLSTRTTRFVCSSSVITLAYPSNPSHLRITGRSFCHSVPILWNRILADLCIPSKFSCYCYQFIFTTLHYLSYTTSQKASNLPTIYSHLSCSIHTLVALLSFWSDSLVLGLGVWEYAVI